VTQQAKAIGLIDEVAAPDRVVDWAVDWCRKVTASPRLAVARTRSKARADLVDLVQRCRDRDAIDLAEAWFRPEVQGPLKQLVEKLTGG